MHSKSLLQTLSKFLFLFFAILYASSLHAATPGNGRGIWFWQSPESPFGSTAVVGNSNREDIAIANLKKWGVTAVYGSYQPKEGVAAIRAWNRKLAANGITSYRLFADIDDLFPECWPATIDKLRNQFIEFNKNAEPQERFQGIAFDIEPHIFRGSQRHTSWKSASGSDRRAYIEDLLLVLENTRTLLDQNAEQNVRIQTSLTTWYYRLDGSIQWRDHADRDQWFARLAHSCDRVSIMDFETASTSTILRRRQDEGTYLAGKSRIALRANLGQEWLTISQFWSAINAVEAITGDSVDIQSYAILAQGIH